MYSIRILTFCFRKLPNYFSLWLKSAGTNKDVDFLVVTEDTTAYTLPLNVTILQMTFPDVLQRLRQSFSCTIDIRDPYKFCDTRPMLGYLFPEWFAGYDFWGGCDLDVIFGDIRGFITDDILAKHDKILTRDHFFLYRNAPEVNERFKLSVGNRDNVYQQVLADPLLYCFGERKPWGMYSLYLEQGFSMYDKPINAEIYNKKKAFKVSTTFSGCVGQVFLWNNGKLTLECVTKQDEVISKEYLYVHLQKRKMDTPDNVETSSFVIVPNRFIIGVETATPEFIKRYSREPLIYWQNVQRLIKRIMNPASKTTYSEKNWSSADKTVNT